MWFSVIGYIVTLTLSLLAMSLTATEQPAGKLPPWYGCPWNILVAGGINAIVAAQHATTTMPIVMAA